jgi:hypothetical protein
MGILRSRVLSPRLTWLGVMAVARFVPLGAPLFYVGGAAAIVTLWPLAYGMFKHPDAARLAGG